MQDVKLICTIIPLKYVCRCSQTTGCNSCSIVSGDVSNCSYRLSFRHLTNPYLSSPSNLFYSWETSNNSWTLSRRTSVQLNEPATEITTITVNRQRPPGTATTWAATTVVIAATDWTINSQQTLPHNQPKIKRSMTESLTPSHINVFFCSMSSCCQCVVAMLWSVDQLWIGELRIVVYLVDNYIHSLARPPFARPSPARSPAYNIQAKRYSCIWCDLVVINN